MSEKCILCTFICFFLEGLVTRTGEQEIWSVSGRLPDNPRVGIDVHGKFKTLK